MQEGRRKGAEGKRSKGLYVSVLALLLTGHLFGPCCTSLWAIGKYPIGASHYEQMLYSQIIHICLVSFKYEFHPVPSGKQMFRGYFFAVVKLTPNASTVASVLKKRLLSIDLLQKSMNDPSPALPELKGRGQDLKFFPLIKGGLRGVISTFARGLLRMN